MPIKSPLGRLFFEHRDYIIIYLTPLILLPLPLVVQDPKGQCGYMLLLMAVYWSTEAIPLSATGLIPMFLSPMFRLQNVVAVSTNYLEENTMLLVGAIFVAIALEKSNLHTRIALYILKTVGTQPAWLLFGFMLPTWFMSMWISNTATTSMMMPTVEAVLLQLEQIPQFQEEPEIDEEKGETNEIENKIEQAPEIKKGVHESFHDVMVVKFTKKCEEITIDEVNKNNSNNTKAEATGGLSSKGAVNAAFETNDIQVEKAQYPEVIKLDLNDEKCEINSEGSNDSKPKRKVSKSFQRLCKGMTLAVAYSASVGGIATLTGTTSNAVMKGAADKIWQEHGYSESPITYGSWMVIGVPVSMINIFFVYVWIRFHFLGWRSYNCCQKSPAVQKIDPVKEVIIKEYEKLGKVRYDEVVVAVLFIILVILWFFRAPGFIKGWGDLFGQDPNGLNYIGDAVPAILIAFILFCIPAFIPKKGRNFESGRAPALLDWPTINENFPWSIIFLMGGGFALADACEISGLSEWIGEQFAVFGSLPGWVMVGIICLITAFFTEITSNAATCTILMPIVASMAEELGLNPLYLMIPVAISTSFAFMLPAAAPQNAIVYSYGRVTTGEMAKAGLILNFLCVFTVDLATHTWAYDLYDFGVIPWNSTVS